MKKILIQLDTDNLPSSFDRVVAVDSDVDELFSYGGVTVENVESLVHGAMFTRGPKDLKSTAIFIGGSHVAAGEALRDKVHSIFFGPVSVSVMMDSNGSNTTAAAAVLCARRHLELSKATALILGGTGPVGQRAAELLAREQATVRLVSRSLERAEQACQSIASRVENAQLQACTINKTEELESALDEVSLIIAAGAAGIRFLSKADWKDLPVLRVAIDLNAVTIGN